MTRDILQQHSLIHELVSAFESIVSSILISIVLIIILYLTRKHNIQLSTSETSAFGRLRWPLAAFDGLRCPAMHAVWLILT